MKKEFELAGMSCAGCVSHVKEALLHIAGITEAEVYLHPQRAVLTMIRPVNVDELQTQLSKEGHYSIKEIAAANLN